jgi:RNA polymerase sigma-70 factor, ECF subfamily
MTMLGGEGAGPPAAIVPITVAYRDGLDWVGTLGVPGPAREQALRDLHALLLRAARHQVWRMRAQLAGGELIEDLANQAADDALLAVLGKLHTFQGRSRFTTWAYKFAVLHAAVAVRRAAWRHRHVPLEDTDIIDAAPSPAGYAEATDFLAAVHTAIATALTPHQRRVVLALLVDDVPVDVLADRLGTSRNAVYKTLHDARVQLRAHLRAAGYATDAGAR